MVAAYHGINGTMTLHHDGRALRYLAIEVYRRTNKKTHTSTVSEKHIQSHFGHELNVNAKQQQHSSTC